MKKLLFISLVIGIVTNSIAQKVIERQYDALNINKFVIDSDIISKIELSTHSEKNLIIRTNIEGETYENVLLSVLELEGILFLKTGFSPYFKAKNDKLAAHKVLSVEMNILLPENIQVEISSILTSVVAEGSYKSFTANLDEGVCFLEDFQGNARIRTKHGAIKITTVGNCSGIASSKKGEVINTLPLNGKYFIQATSEEGNIFLSQNNY